MNWQLNPYTFALIISALVSAGIAVYAWGRRPASGATTLSLLMWAFTEWSLGYAVETASADLATKVFWAKVQYLGIAAVPTLILVIALEYTGREKWLARRYLAVLAMPPLLIMLLAWTNGIHHLVWRNTSLVSYRAFTTLDLEHGVAFWLYVGYAYLLLVISVALFAQAALRPTFFLRRQSLAMLVGALFPWIGNLVYVSGLSPFPALDLTNFSYPLAGLALAWGLFRYRLLDIVPIARDTVIESIADGVLVLDARGRIVDLNPAARRLIGRAAGEVVGRPAGQVLARWPDLAQSYLEAGETHAQVVVEGEEKARYYDMRISPLYGQQDGLRGRVIVLRDITAQKEAEAALQEHARDLEARNAELDAFAHTVAHDLRGPLTTLIGYADFLKVGHDTMSGEELEGHLSALGRSARKMLNIVKELLLLASVRTMKEVAIGPLDMAAIVTQAQERLATMLAECGCQVFSPPDWPLAVGYAPWVEEIWVNYLSNALKYGGEPPCLQLGAEALPDGMVRFWVRDNGPGLSQQEASQLFVPFTRLAQARAEGHGLGLSIVRRIVERLGGQVGVESAPGQGSLFSFTLPGGPHAQA